MLVRLGWADDPIYGGVGKEDIISTRDPFG
jgi:hypothetical protein